MKNKTYLLVLLITLFFFNAKSQETGFYLDGLDESSNRLQGKIRGDIFYLTPTSNQNFFLQRDWQQSKIVLTDGDVYENLKTRYNVYRDELVVYNDKIRSLYTVNKDIVSQFYFKEFSERDEAKEHKFVKLLFTGTFAGDRFFEELYSGNRSLLGFHNIREVKVSPYVDRLGTKRDIEYRLKVAYYIYSEKHGFVRLYKRKRSFYKALPDHKKEIRKIFRKNNISLLDESALIQAFKLIDEEGLLN